MKITKYFFSFTLLVTAIAISYAFWDKSLWAGMVFTLIWSALWWLIHLVSTDTISSAFFIVIIGACLAGSFAGLNPSFLLLGVITALNAWDAERFYRRWKDVKAEPWLQKLERKHLLRILMVDGTAVFLGVIGLSIKAQMNFRIILIFGFLAVLSLSWMISLLRKNSQKP